MFVYHNDPAEQRVWRCGATFVIPRMSILITGVTTLPSTRQTSLYRHRLASPEVQVYGFGLVVVDRGGQAPSRVCNATLNGRLD